MGFGWDLFQQLQIRSIDSKASEAKIKSRSNEADLLSLEEKLDALSLACHAMWEILQEKHGITNEQLERKIESLDLRDGTLDGKLSNKITNCPDCGRKINERHKNCFYCGADITNGKLFP